MLNGFNGMGSFIPSFSRLILVCCYVIAAFVGAELNKNNQKLAWIIGREFFQESTY
jgi:hypothetical protein